MCILFKQGRGWLAIGKFGTTPKQSANSRLTWSPVVFFLRSLFLYHGCLQMAEHGLWYTFLLLSQCTHVVWSRDHNEPIKSDLRLIRCFNNTKQDFQNKEVIFCDQTSTEPGDQNSPACQAFCDVSILCSAVQLHIIQRYCRPNQVFLEICIYSFWF